ncbi:hypothetical protein [Caulobacter sp. NIBR1757]|uniref:hypothetical protein n=1 Tax=Caulobacter sp. NIBR1757 TaxID=3016000 RepID=UPI0022F07361|nr:hypothetical protein [Caulobacter sp. NIBR1757]WGM38031.1 hypothetical protein AMEJIAPC_00932 [Caulobacter sp. NIBR1757]
MTFTTEADLAAVADGVIAMTLPKPAWTHAAHFACAVWIVMRRPDLVAERDLPNLIRAYNESTDTPNTDSGGYHETITQASLRAVRTAVAEGGTPVEVLRRLLQSHGRSDWLLKHWSRERLFSVEARRRWLEPDLAPLRG